MLKIEHILVTRRKGDLVSMETQGDRVNIVNPLTIDGSISDNFVDAEIDGSFLSVAKILGLFLLGFYIGRKQIYANLEA